ASRLTKSSKILPRSGTTFYQPLRQSRSRCGDKNGSRKKRRRDEKKKNRDYGRNPPAGLAARAAARRPLLRHLPTAFAADRPRASRRAGGHQHAHDLSLGRSRAAPFHGDAGWQAARLPEHFTDFNLKGANLMNTKRTCQSLILCALLALTASKAPAQDAANTLA